MFTDLSARTNQPSAIERRDDDLTGRNPAYTSLNNKRLRILEGSVSVESYNAKAGQVVESKKSLFTVSCGSGALDVHRVQLPGKKPATVKDISNSRPDLFSRGVTFSSEQPK